MQVGCGLHHALLSPLCLHCLAKLPQHNSTWTFPKKARQRGYIFDHICIRWLAIDFIKYRKYMKIQINHFCYRLPPAIPCSSAFLGDALPWTTGRFRTCRLKISKICIAVLQLHFGKFQGFFLLFQPLTAASGFHWLIETFSSVTGSLTHMECDHLYTWVTCTHQGCAHRLRSLVHISLRKTREKWPHGFIRLGLMGGHGERGHGIWGGTRHWDIGTLIWGHGNKEAQATTSYAQKWPVTCTSDRPKLHVS